MNVRFFIGPVSTGKELSFRAGSNIRSKDFIRIIKIGDDDVETGKVFAKVRVERATTRKKAGQRTGFYGPQAVHQPSGQRELGDVRIAQELDVSLRELLAQSR
jgi:hypothetical protein